jgi:hypothetical protein
MGLAAALVLDWAAVAYAWVAAAGKSSDRPRRLPAAGFLCKLVSSMYHNQGLGQVL